MSKNIRLLGRLTSKLKPKSSHVGKSREPSERVDEDPEGRLERKGLVDGGRDGGSVGNAVAVLVNHIVLVVNLGDLDAVLFLVALLLSNARLLGLVELNVMPLEDGNGGCRGEVALGPLAGGVVSSAGRI